MNKNEIKLQVQELFTNIIYALVYTYKANYLVDIKCGEFQVYECVELFIF